MMNTIHKFITIEPKKYNEQIVSFSEDINIRELRFKNDYPYDTRKIKQYTFKFKTMTSKKPYCVYIKTFHIKCPETENSVAKYKEQSLKGYEGSKAKLLYDSFMEYKNKPVKIENVYSVTIDHHCISGKELKQGKNVFDQLESYYTDNLKMSYTFEVIV